MRSSSISSSFRSASNSNNQMKSDAANKTTTTKPTTMITMKQRWSNSQFGSYPHHRGRGWIARLSSMPLRTLLFYCIGIGVALMLISLLIFQSSSKQPLGFSLRNNCRLPGYNNSNINNKNIDSSKKMKAKREAYMTLVSSEKISGSNGLSYVDAAIVLIHGLRRYGSTKEIVVLASEELSERSVQRLARAGSSASRAHQTKNNKNDNDDEDYNNKVTVIRVENVQPPIKPGDNIQRMRYSFSKLWGWTLEDYSKIVYLDADHLVLSNVDDLFDHPELSATPELELPRVSFLSWQWWTRSLDIRRWFNSNDGDRDPLEVLHERPRTHQVFQCGMFVFEPRRDQFEELLREKDRVSDYPRFGVDTGFMNCYFRDAWRPLPFGYNAQHFCNSSPNGAKCGAFLRLWERRPEAVKTVHDKFFLYEEDDNELNRLWYQQYREATAGMGDADSPLNDKESDDNLAE